MQEDGKVVNGPDLTVKHFSGLTLPNPFVIGSGIPTLNPICLESVHCQYGMVATLIPEY